MGKLFNSAAFRLTLLYMFTFGISVTVLLVFIYYSIGRDVNRQLRHEINVQLADLGREFILDGPYATAESVKHLLRLDRNERLVLMLIDPDWNIIAGNLERWPGGSTTKPASWITVPLEKKQGRAAEAIAINSSLPGGYILLVGRKLESVERVRKVIADVLYICFGITVVLSAAGGFFLSRTIERRLEGINQTCRKVMGGDLQTRVAVSGSADEFDHLAGNVNAMLNRICELIEGVRDISHNVAHDLRTPLGRLRNRLEILAAGPQTSDAVHDELRGAIAEVDALVATFNAILRISQAEMGAGFEHFQNFDLSATAENISELYRPVAEDKSLQYRAEIEQGLLCNGDRHLLSQAIANLLDNAIKYTPSGEVALTLSHDEDGLLLTVSDDGPGIAPEYYEKVTGKFFRMESSRHSPGSGLGLSLVQAAIKLHGGELLFGDNAPGLKVTVKLPRTTQNA